MEQPLAISEIKKRVFRALLSLSLRQVALRAISFISINLVLANILSVETLGIFNIAAGIVTFFAFFADVGLSASLIQKKTGVTSEDIKTSFTIQLILVGIVSLLIILFAPLIGQIYRLDFTGVLLVRALGLSFFITSFKVIPAVILERNLKFQPLVLVEMVETVLFNGLLIALSFQGLGLSGFAIAALVRAVSGTILIYLIAPVRLGFKINWSSARELLNFGIPFQLNNILALVKDRLVPLVVARIIGSTGVGYVTWAQSMAFLPLEAMNIIIRITFPAFSRLQEDKEVLARAVDKSLFLTSLTVYPILFGIGALLPAVVAHVVSAKWLPAIPDFYFFAFSTFWAVISTTYTNTLNAIGYIKTTLKLMVFWTIITWVLTPILSLQFGHLGVAISSFLISWTSILTIILMKRVLKVNIAGAILIPILASSLMGVVLFGLSPLVVKDKLSLFLLVLLGGGIYLLLIYLLAGKRVLADFKNIRNV